MLVIQQQEVGKEKKREEEKGETQQWRTWLPLVWGWELVFETRLALTIRFKVVYPTIQQENGVP